MRCWRPLARDRRRRPEPRWTWVYQRPASPERDEPAGAKADAIHDARRLGVLGGTFDPFTSGTSTPATPPAQRWARRSASYPRARSAPSPRDPQATAFHRFALVSLAIEDRPACRVSDMELARPASYTIDTLRALHAEGWPPSQIFFILGADAFAEIATWREFPRSSTRAFRRGGAARDDSRRGGGADAELAPGANPATPPPRPVRPRIFLVAARTRNVSSTAIRTRLAAGLSIDDFAPAVVARHIVAHHLYGAVNDLHGDRLRGGARELRRVGHGREQGDAPAEVMSRRGGRGAGQEGLGRRRARPAEGGRLYRGFVVCTGGNPRQISAIAEPSRIR